MQYGPGYASQPASSSSAAFNFNQLPYVGSAQPVLPSPLGAPQPSPSQGHDPSATQEFLPTPHTTEGSFDDRFIQPERQEFVSDVQLTLNESPGIEFADQPSAIFDQADREDWEIPLSDDDVSMGESDDEILEVRDPRIGALIASQLEGPMSGFGTRMRSFSAYADTGLLTAYFPSAQTSPLTDPRTATVFWHFVNVTGPSMSLYERHPMDHSRLAESRPAPIAGHNIWTCKYY